jgi:hypothetical protein
MAQIAIPDDVLHILAACEAAYADASRKGYADNRDVIAAAADLRSAYRALVIANSKLTASKGSSVKHTRWESPRARAAVATADCLFAMTMAGAIGGAMAVAAAGFQVWGRCRQHPASTRAWTSMRTIPFKLRVVGLKLLPVSLAAGSSQPGASNCDNDEKITS